MPAHARWIRRIGERQWGAGNSVDQPARSGKPWAPFRFAQAYAAGATVSLQKARSDLVRSLPVALLTAPFRWRLEDGHTLRRMPVTHRLAQSGDYLVQVYAYVASRAQWLLFDSGLVQVVPAGQLGHANLSYHLLQGLGDTFTWVERVVACALTALLIYSLLSSVL